MSVLTEAERALIRRRMNELTRWKKRKREQQRSHITMKRKDHRFTKDQRSGALKLIARTEKQLTPALFGWAVRKHLAINAAQRKVARIQREAQREVERLVSSTRV